MKSKSKRIMLYCIPFVIQLIIHIVASFLTERAGDNNLWRVFAAIMMTVIYMLLGEGYGSLAFIVAGFYDRFGAYVAVIAFSVFGAGANFVGYMFKGTEGDQCLWMTIIFWCIDLFLFVFSIKRISQLASKKNKAG